MLSLDAQPCTTNAHSYARDRRSSLPVLGFQLMAYLYKCNKVCCAFMTLNNHLPGCKVKLMAKRKKKREKYDIPIL